MRVAFGFWWVLVLLVGCRQLVGIDERRVAVDDALEVCGLPSRGGECGACFSQSCCEEAEACGADSTCLAIENCQAPCASGDSACLLACSERWQPALPRALLEDCRQAACAASCDAWGCVGKVSWQVPEPVPPTVTLRAQVGCTGCSPVGGIARSEGVRVRACSTADPACRAVLGSADSDLDGNVELVLRTEGSPLSVFLEFHKPGFLDVLLLVSTPPLSFDFDAGTVLMDQRDSIDQLAADVGTTYDPELALVKVRVSDCHLGSSTGFTLDWSDPGEATIAASTGATGWNAIAVNLPVPEILTTRAVARLETPGAPLVAVVNLVLRKNAVTLAPFVTPTP